MNKWIGIGNLTRDPEIRQTDTTTIAKFGIAVARKYKREGEPEADFLNCTAFGKTAEFIEKYFNKGNKIAIVGRIQTGSYTNKEGQKVYTTDIMIDEVEFAGSKNTDEQAKPQTDPNGYMIVSEGLEDELPFN